MNEVARVGDASINQETFQALLNLRAGGGSNRFATMEAKAALLDELIRREAVFAKARAAGFDQRPDIRESVKRLIAGKYQEEQMKLKGAEEPVVSQEEIEQYYQEHAAAFATPAKARGAIILLKISPLAEPEKRAELLARAQSLLDQASATPPADFARLVAENSEDQTTRYRAGDIGWLTREAKSRELDPAVTEALFSLQKPGDFAPLISARKAVYILKLLDTQPAGILPLQQVKDAIVYKLRKQKLEEREQDFFASMKAGLDITINRPLLESIRPPPFSPKSLPATPGTVAQK